MDLYGHLDSLDIAISTFSKIMWKQQSAVLYSISGWTEDRQMTLSKTKVLQMWNVNYWRPVFWQKVKWSK